MEWLIRLINSTPKKITSRLSGIFMYFCIINLKMAEVQIYPLMGFVIGVEYLNSFEDNTMKSIDIYFLMIGISFRWN